MEGIINISANVHSAARGKFQTSTWRGYGPWKGDGTNIQFWQFPAENLNRENFCPCGRLGLNSFIFMQFSAKMLPSNRLVQPCLCGCRPHREILDPPLAYLCSASLFLSLRLLARSLSSSAARCRSNSIRLEGSISSYRFLSLAFFFDGRPR